MKTAGRWMTVSINEDSGPVDDCQYKWRQRAGGWLSVSIISPTVGGINSRGWSSKTVSLPELLVSVQRRCATSIGYSWCQTLLSPTWAPERDFGFARQWMFSCGLFVATDKPAESCVRLHLRNYMASEHSKPQPEHTAQLCDCWSCLTVCNEHS